jgi:hypothetical protein
MIVEMIKVRSKNIAIINKLIRTDGSFKMSTELIASRATFDYIATPIEY